MKNFNIFWFHSFQSRKIFKIRQFLKNPKVQMLTNSYCSRSSRLCQHSLFYQVIQLQHLVFPSGSFTFASSGFSNTTSVFSFPGQELLICHMPQCGIPALLHSLTQSTHGCLQRARERALGQQLPHFSDFQITGSAPLCS